MAVAGTKQVQRNIKSKNTTQQSRRISRSSKSSRNRKSRRFSRSSKNCRSRVNIVSGGAAAANVVEVAGVAGADLHEMPSKRQDSH